MFLIIINRRSFPHPPAAVVRYNLYVHMYALGYCVEKHRCDSCGAHGPGKALVAQVIPRGVTKNFAKLR